MSKALAAQAEQSTILLKIGVRPRRQARGRGAGMVTGGDYRG